MANTKKNPEPTGGTFYGFYALVPAGQTREQVLADIVAQADKGKRECRMPCGNKQKWNKHTDIPLVNVPCPCGDPKHWLVYWSDQN